MKKLLTVLLATSCVLAFAETTVVTTTSKTTETHFDNSKMKCKTTELRDGTKGTVIKKECRVQPKVKGDDKKTVRFIDDNSGKKVKCEFDKDGNLTIGQCMSVD